MTCCLLVESWKFCCRSSLLDNLTLLETNKQHMHNGHNNHKQDVFNNYYRLSVVQCYFGELKNHLTLFFWKVEGVGVESKRH